MPIRHIVLFRVHKGVTEERIDAALSLLTDLGGASGALEWTAQRSLDARKGVILVEDATFATERDFSAFQTSPEHQAAGRVLTEISDWWVGDYLTL